MNALVFTGFAGVALLIAVVGVAGVLAFSVSARAAIGIGGANSLADLHLLHYVFDRDRGAGELQAP